MVDNVYTPKKFKTVTPPVDHRRYSPNATQITDEDRGRFFTNLNQELLQAVRRIKNI